MLLLLLLLLLPAMLRVISGVEQSSPFLWWRQRQQQQRWNVQPLRNLKSTSRHRIHTPIQGHAQSLTQALLGFVISCFLRVILLSSRISGRRVMRESIVVIHLCYLR